MAALTIAAADYQTELTNLHNHLNKGTAPSAYQQRRLVALLRDAVTRLGSGSAGMTTQTNALATEIANVATAKAAVVTAAATVATAKAAMVTSIATLANWNTLGEVVANNQGAADACAAVESAWAPENTRLGDFATTWATQNTALATFATESAATKTSIIAIGTTMGVAPVLITNVNADGD